MNFQNRIFNERRILLPVAVKFRSRCSTQTYYITAAYYDSQLCDIPPPGHVFLSYFEIHRFFFSLSNNFGFSRQGGLLHISKRKYYLAFHAWLESPSGCNICKSARLQGTPSMWSNNNVHELHEPATASHRFGSHATPCGCCWQKDGRELMKY